MREDKNTARLVVRARSETVSNLPPWLSFLRLKDKGAFVMQKIECKLTVFFSDPFWTGVYERVCGGELTVSKVVFGAEPRDNEVYEYFVLNWHRLHFGPPVPVSEASKAKANPKRIRRAAKKELEDKGVGTKSQQALKLLREEGKAARIEKTRLRNEEAEKLRFELKQRKKKEKHRGH